MISIPEILSCLFIGLIGFFLFALAIGPAIIKWLENKF
jgi:hypothetical protein